MHKTTLWCGWTTSNSILSQSNDNRHPYKTSTMNIGTHFATTHHPFVSTWDACSVVKITIILVKISQGQRNLSGWSSFGRTTCRRSSNQYSKILAKCTCVLYQEFFTKHVLYYRPTPHVLTAHLHGESCFLTVQLTKVNFFFTLHTKRVATTQPLH